MNILCLGAGVMDPTICWTLTQIFLAATFSGAERHQRRLAKVRAVEASR
jgi:ribose 5-phosphate isomerase B